MRKAYLIPTTDILSIKPSCFICGVGSLHSGESGNPQLAPGRSGVGSTIYGD